MLRAVARQALRRAGYAVRDVGTGVTGIDRLHDAAVLLGGISRPVVFDVGANVGEIALAILRTFRDAQLTAFEPSPVTLTTLRRRLPSEVKVEAIALSDTIGRLPFHVDETYSVNDSLLPPVGRAGRVVEVEVDTVDRYCELNRIGTIHLLKIDTQGNDLGVLRGAAAMLRNRQIHLFTCEATFLPMYEGQSSLVDQLGYADAIGYELVGIYDQTYSGTRLWYADLLFQRRP